MKRKNVFEISGNTTLPKQVIWNGQNKEGFVMPNGSYYVYIEVTMLDNTIHKSLTYTVRLDTKPPAIKIRLADSVPFTPDGDSIDDLLKVMIDHNDYPH